MRVKSAALLCAVVLGVQATGAADVQATLAVTGGEGFRGTVLASRVLLSTDTELQGWSFGIAWDPAAVSLVDYGAGVMLDTVNNGNRADYLQVSLIEPGAGGPGITQAVVISFMMSAVLPVGENYTVLDARFKLEAEPEDRTPIETEVFFTDTLGSPPVATVIVVGGASYAPNTANGPFTINPPPEDCRVQDFVCDSDPDNVFLSWTFLGCDGERPFDYLLLYRDKQLLAELTISDTSYDDLNLGPGFYDYTLAWVYWPAAGDPITLSYVSCRAEVIALMVTDIDTRAAFLPGTVPDPASAMAFIPGEIVITGRGFRDGVNDEGEPLCSVFIGGRKAPVIEVIEDTTIRAAIPCAPALGVYDVQVVVEGRGEYTVPQSFTYGWLRGDVNIDGTIDLQDVIIVLDYLFRFAATPPCMKAVDANDDGQIDLADPIFLMYFVAGVDPLWYKPPPPFDVPLIVDPTPDALTCTLEGYECLPAR